MDGGESVASLGHVPYGEWAEMTARLIVSTAHGIFEPAPADRAGASHGVIEIGDTVGTVGETTVVSTVTGTFMGLLAHPGERIRVSQALAWVLPLEA